MELKKITLSVLIIFLFSCTEPQPQFKLYENILNNQSGVDVTMIFYRTKNDTIQIANNNAYRFELSMKSGYGEISLMNCDSLGIVFKNNKKKMYTYMDKSNRNPLLTKSFVITEVNEVHYIFRYTFTEEDYRNSLN